MLTERIKIFEDVEQDVNQHIKFIVMFVIMGSFSYQRMKQDFTTGI